MAHHFILFKNISEILIFNVYILKGFHQTSTIQLIRFRFLIFMLRWSLPRVYGGIRWYIIVNICARISTDIINQLEIIENSQCIGIFTIFINQDYNHIHKPWRIFKSSICNISNKCVTSKSLLEYKSQRNWIYNAISIIIEKFMWWL